MAGKVAIWASARVSCSAASTSAERCQRPLSRFAPQARSLLDQAGLGAVTRQQLRLVLGDFRELAFEGFGDAGVKRASRLAQQRAIGRVLHQGMLEQIGRVRRHALPEQQTSRNETVERRLQLRLRLAHHRSQQSMRELSPDRRADLRDLFGRAEPIEPRHQRGVQACGTARAGDGTAAAVRSRVALALRLQHRLGHFLDEQWNAVGALDDVLP